MHEDTRDLTGAVGDGDLISGLACRAYCFVRTHEESHRVRHILAMTLGLVWHHQRAVDIDVFGDLRKRLQKQPTLNLLVGYHGELKLNLFHNTRIIWGLYYPKKVKGYLLYF